MILDTGRVGELVNVIAVMPQKLGARKHQRVEKKATSLQSLTYQGMAPFIVSICFAASSHNTTRWISLAFLIDMFSSSSSFFPYPIYFCCFFLFTTLGWWFLQKEVVISPYSTLHKTLVYSGEWGAWWKPASSEKIGCRQSPHFPPLSW